MSLFSFCSKIDKALNAEPDVDKLRKEADVIIDQKIRKEKIARITDLINDSCSNPYKRHQDTYGYFSFPVSQWERCCQKGWDEAMTAIAEKIVDGEL